MHTRPTVTFSPLRAPSRSISSVSPDFQNERFLQARIAQVLARARVLGHLPVFAVNRQEKARPHQVQYQPQLFRAAVSGDVDRRIHGAVNHVRAAFREVVDHPVNRLFIARNNACAQSHGVAGLNGQVLVIIHRDARHGRHRLALRARNHRHHFAGRRPASCPAGAAKCHRGAQQPEAMRDLGDVVSCCGRETPLCVRTLRQIEDLLQAVNGRAEAGDDQSPFGAKEDFFQPRATARSLSV